VLACVLSVCAQDKKPIDHSGKKSAKQSGSQTQQAAAGGMATKQAAEMQKALDALQGTWSTKGVMEKSDFMPNGGSDAGTAVFKPGPGGLSLTEDYNSKGSLGNYRGLGVIWFDPKDQMFHAVWCDGMTPSGCADIGTGKWEGDKMVFNGKMNMGEKAYDVRATMGPFEGNTFKYVEEVGENGQFKPSMTITYFKKSGAPTATKPNTKM
jgi:hypothetical protein